VLKDRLVGFLRLSKFDTCECNFVVKVKANWYHLKALEKLYIFRPKSVLNNF
jgi:hypothetical protein